MKLPATPADFIVVQLDPSGSVVDSAATSADLATGDGSELPTIPAGKWLPAIVVNVNDPDYVQLADWRSGDWILITQVSSDTITFARTGTARDLNPGEYVFVNLSSYMFGVLLQKIEALEYMLAIRAGLNDGIPQWGTDGAPDALSVVQQSSPDMTVKVKAGPAFINGQVYRLESDTDSDAVTAPSSNNRIDLVQAVIGADGSLDGISIKQGSESATPTAPTPDTDCLALAEILLTPSTTSITTSDITDVRVRV